MDLESSRGQNVDNPKKKACNEKRYKPYMFVNQPRTIKNYEFFIGMIIRNYEFYIKLRVFYHELFYYHYLIIYSTVTDLAKLRGLSTSVPLNTAT